MSLALDQTRHQLREQLCVDIRHRVAPRIAELCQESTRAGRIWLPQCGTGEEAYIVAACFHECGCPLGYRLFGTDSSPQNVRSSRGGRYDQNLEKYCMQDLLTRYFSRVNSHFQVRNNLRDACVFSQHDPRVDPPFSRMDLIVFANEFEGLNGRQLASLFYYSLQSSGYLWFHSDHQSAGALQEFFNPSSLSPFVYQKRTALTPFKFDFPRGRREDHSAAEAVGSSRVDLQACKLEYSIVSPK